MGEVSADVAKGDVAFDRSERAAAERLLGLGGKARFFRAEDGRTFARVPVENRREVYGLKSSAFRDWLIGGHLQQWGVVPSDGAVRRVIGALEAIARFGGSKPSLFIRVGSDRAKAKGVYYIDLGDPSGLAVEIGAEGWALVEKTEVDFRRPEGLLPLPTPSGDGSIELLRPYVNLTERDFRLLVVWMAAALRPAGPYPILAVYGEQGSAKSTLAKVIRLLIDPQDAPLLSLPDSRRDMMITAANGWLLAYDNIGVIPAWLSDGLCLLATGGAYAGRAVRSDDERAIIHAQRPVILNGIEEFVRRGDLSDRCVFLHLPSISARQRRREDEFWDAFRRDQPRILGGLLDVIVGGLRELPLVKLTDLPRMADFAAFAEAIGRGLGWDAGAVLADYELNRHDATATQIEDSVLATAMLSTVRATRTMLNWCGSATDFLAEVGGLAGKQVTRSAGWPKSPRALTNELRRIAPQLRHRGLFVSFERTNDKRLIVVRNQIGEDRFGHESGHA